MTSVRPILIAASLVAVALCCRAADETVRDGSSFEKAFVVGHDPKHAFEREMDFIRRRHPDANFSSVEQGIASHNGRLYEIIALGTTSGKKLTIYFDLQEDDPLARKPK